MSTPAYPRTALRVHRFAGLAPGPRLIVTGAVHGNETCGTRAIERVLADLDRGALTVVRGTLTLVPVCNPLAYAEGRRMGERNLNRRLLPTATPAEYEDHIANVLCPLLAEHDALLDLHSFRSAGQPFVLRGPENNTGTLEPFAREAEERALCAHLGVTRVVEGWMSAYAGGVARRRERQQAAGGAPAAAAIEDPTYGIGTTEYMRSRGGYAVTLECGQHDDPAAPDVGERAIRQTLALLGLVDAAPEAPQGPFEVLRLDTVIDRLHPDDQFVKAWTSFDPLAEGELIARRHDGTEVRAPGPGRIVFPDPGARAGHEWFYLARPSTRPVWAA
ncbi:MAG: succinylglutamate desuccinylase [Rubrivivax sp.]|jgi:predicted deacylase